MAMVLSLPLLRRARQDHATVAPILDRHRPPALRTHFLLLALLLAVVSNFSDVLSRFRFDFL